jgi:hypothetical protein
MPKQLAPERLPDWEARLSALVRERMREPFRWGSHDCALWGADVVHALTGADFGDPFRGKYSDAEGAALALRQYGAGTIVRTFDKHLHRTPFAQAKRGDLVKLGKSDVAPMGAIGVCMGGFGLFVSDMGLERRPRSEWSLAWKV